MPVTQLYHSYVSVIWENFHGLHNLLSGFLGVGYIFNWFIFAQFGHIGSSRRSGIQKINHCLELQENWRGNLKNQVTQVYIVSVLGQEERYTVKYGLSPREIPRAENKFTVYSFSPS